MIPARRNYANFGWATPSAVQLNSAYRDPVPWLDLKDAHFYKAGNHYILHHLDYYLMRKNKQITEDYLPKQMKFWKDMEDTMNQLESELTVYTRLLPAEKQSGHSDKSPFQQGFSQYGSPQRPTRSITRLPTSETPERSTPPDLSC